jgi:hypothetical protein
MIGQSTEVSILYINTFLKIKQENSSYPSWCQSESNKLKYFYDYEKLDGIQLNQNNVSVNEGLKSISKFLLNSMWGRYCLQTNKIKYFGFFVKRIV